jgi:hypothetical protein
MIGNFRSRLFHSPRLSVIGVLVGITIFFLAVTSAFSGCESNPQDFSQSKKLNEDRCDELIKSSLDMLQPDRFGITSYSEAVVGVLNQWSSKCAASLEVSNSVDPQVMALLNGLIASDEFNLSSKSSYNKRDVEHIRDCLLYKELVDSALKLADTDLGRTVELFEFVTRNISLLPEAEQPVSLTPFEIILFGRGTSEDRAWIFANLLRQLRIDVVILRPRKQNGEALPQSHWLVGALLDDKVYLFDMRLGLPIPSKQDDGKSVTVRTPASLSEVLQSDEGFRKLDIDAKKSYPLKSNDLRTLHVELIGNGGFWFPKMKRLQMSMTGESVLIYDGLEDGENGDGLFSRIAKQGNGRWKRSDISFWSYPEKSLQNSAILGGIQRQKLRELHRPFDAPVEMSTNPQTNRGALNPKTGQLLPTRRQLKARIDHIMGRFDTVILRYQQLRLDLDVRADSPVLPVIHQVHGRAQEDAFFWTGICQIEQGEFSTAAETLLRYRRRYGPRGVWTNHAIYLLALSYAENDKLAVGLQVLSAQLEQNAVDPFVRLRNQSLINRWRTLRTLRQSRPDKINK